MSATIWPRILPSRLLSRNISIKIHETIILPVVLYGCETWFVTLRKERSLRVFVKRPKREEVTGDWRKLHNEKLHVTYQSPYFIWLSGQRG
jgi:hypothetical protein